MTARSQIRVREYSCQSQPWMEEELINGMLRRCLICICLFGEKEDASYCCFFSERSQCLYKTSIDTCNGFLHEWWTQFHDRFQHQLEAKENPQIRNNCQTTKKKMGLMDTKIAVYTNVIL